MDRESPAQDCSNLSKRIINNLIEAPDNLCTVLGLCREDIPETESEAPLMLMLVF